MKMNLKIRSYFVWYGILVTVIFISVTTILSILHSDYDNIHQTVSELGSPGSPHALYYNLNFILLGFGLILYAIALWREFYVARSGSLYLGIIGILNIIGGIFHIDLKNLNSLSSIVHTISGLMIFFFFILFFFSFRKAIKKNKFLTKSRLPYMICGFVGLLGVLFTIIDAKFSGLWQRIFYIGFFGCLWVIAIPMLRKNHI